MSVTLFFKTRESFSTRSENKGLLGNIKIIEKNNPIFNISGTTGSSGINGITGPSGVSSGFVDNLYVANLVAGPFTGSSVPEIKIFRDIYSGVDFVMPEGKIIYSITKCDNLMTSGTPIIKLGPDTLTNISVRGIDDSNFSQSKGIKIVGNLPFLSFFNSNFTVESSEFIINSGYMYMDVYYK